MDKPQFSLSDFLGYVIPGASALVVMLFFYHYPNGDYSSLDGFMQTVKQYSYLMVKKSSSMGVILPSAFLVLSYIAGHLLAYLSSITIERFAIWIYGYPSEFLFYKTGWSHIFSDIKKVCLMRPRYWKIKACVYTLVRVVIIGLLMPLSLVVFLIKLLTIDNFLVKSLDPFLKDVVEKKLESLRTKLNLPNDREYRDADIHRIVHEYCYGKFDSMRQKMDKYVAIYDLMRSLTLIMVYVSWKLIVKNAKTFTWFAPIDCNIWWLIILSLLVTLLFFMAFMKFYRRYTLESYICIASDQEL